MLLEGFKVVQGLGKVRDADLEVLAALVVKDREFLVFDNESAVFALNDLKARLHLTVVVVSLVGKTETLNDRRYYFETPVWEEESKCFFNLYTTVSTIYSSTHYSSLPSNQSGKHTFFRKYYIILVYSYQYYLFEVEDKYFNLLRQARFLLLNSREFLGEAGDGLLELSDADCHLLPV